ADAVPLGFAASYARLVADHVRALDLDARPVLSALGLPDSATPESDAPQWVPAARLSEALSVATELCQDPHTPWRIAQQV
uniref:hypothetical protein n=1 Tax=Salmonella enterica TaxID=28901 RepID=UPI0020C3D57A